jgi:hypothetical protein
VRLELVVHTRDSGHAVHEEAAQWGSTMLPASTEMGSPQAAMDLPLRAQAPATGEQPVAHAKPHVGVT